MPWCRSAKLLDRARPPGDALERRDDRTRRKRKPRSPRPAPPSPRRTKPTPRPSSRLNAAYKKYAGFIPDERPAQRRARRGSTSPSWMPCCKRASPTTSWPRPSRPALPNASKSLKEALDQFDVVVQELPDAVGRPGRADVSGEVLRGAGQTSTRPSGSTSSSWSTAIPGSARSSATWATSTSSPWPSANSTPWRPTRPRAG